MNCSRAFEIDLEDLLLEPASAECLEFEDHCASCPDCAGELALQRGLLARLTDEPAKAEHPSDALLLRFRRDPEALSDAERRGVHAHLADCMPCDSAYRATLALVPEPQRSPVARFVASLRDWLSPGGLPAWAPSAAALLLMAGLFFTVSPFGTPQPDPGDPVTRGIPSEFAVEVEMHPGARASLPLYGLADDDLVMLRVSVPAALRGSEVEARIAIRGGPAIHQERLGWDPDDETRGVLLLRAGAFERDTYQVTLSSAAGETVSYPLDVR